ncbi:MAG: TonB-dependent receptor plug domain-containing protein [Paludibacteraceae bacterium]|nr:TonB-dependent receptor plug domain-containing protein [Paludibacteraceae bacterium]
MMMLLGVANAYAQEEVSDMPDIELDEVTIVGRNEIREMREATMPVSVLSIKQLEGTTTNINDALARTTGITVRNTGGVGSASRISVRGLEGKRMGIYIDEAAIGQLSDYMSLNDVPTDMIERIEVYKGIVPYRFGGSALGGAVNVVTKEYPPVYLDASYEIASFNTHKLNSAFKRNNKKTGLQFGLGGVLTYSDNSYEMELPNLDNRVVKRDHDRFKKAMIGGSLKATKWYFDEAKMELVYTATNAQIQGIDFDIREAYTHGQAGIGAITLKRDNFLFDGLDFDFDACYSYGQNGLYDAAPYRYDWDGNRYNAVSAYGGEQGNYASDSDNRTHDFTSKLNLNYLLNKHSTFNLNLYATHTRQKPENELMDLSFGYQTNFPSQMSSFTVGFSYDLTLFDGKFMSATTIKNFNFSSDTKVLEYTFINKPKEVSLNRNYWGGSESLRYKLTKHFLAKASFSSEVRIPTSEELAGNGYSILPATDLRPERCNGLNAGLLYHRNHKYGFIEIEGNYFLNELQDMIRYQADMIPSMARYANFGIVRTKGVELEFKGDVARVLYLYANATYQDLRDKREYETGSSAPNPTYNKRMPNIPYLLANLGIELHKENLFGGKDQNSRFLVDASYIHEYFYDFEMSKYQDRKIPTSLTFDAGIEHSFKRDSWILSFKVKNLTDQKVYSDLNRPLPGRNFAFKVRYVMK